MSALERWTAGTEHEANPKRRTLRLDLDPGEVENLLDLPRGAHLVAMKTEIDPPRLTLVIASPDFDEVDEHCESPRVNRKVVELAYGDRFEVRDSWDWPQRSTALAEADPLEGAPTSLRENVQRNGAVADTYARDWIEGPHPYEPDPWCSNVHGDRGRCCARCGRTERGEPDGFVHDEVGS